MPMTYRSARGSQRFTVTERKKSGFFRQIPAILGKLAELEFFRLPDHFGAHETNTRGTYTVCLYIACSIHFS
jgi:hypothetical protein